MSRIAIDARIWRASAGGVGRYARNLVTELAKIDHDNDYTVILTPEDKLEYQLTAPNFRPLVVDIPYYSYAEQLRLPAILNEQNFDLVHFTQFNHPIRYRRPFVTTIHDLIMHLYPSGRQTKSLAVKLAYRWTMSDTRRSAAVIVPSQATKHDLVSMLHFSPEKIVVTPEGSEAIFRPQSSAEIKAIKDKLNLPERFLLFVSRWEPYKGLPALLEAHQALKKDFPDLGLVICGRPLERAPEVAAAVRQHQQTDPSVITPGFVTDAELAALYSAATVYVHPSWYEGFGIMILEAFAAGVPVVTSNLSSLPEVVGDAGLLVDPHNVAELIAAIKRVLTEPDLATELVKKGRERVNEYSWSRMAEQTLAVYQKAQSQLAK